MPLFSGAKAAPEGCLSSAPEDAPGPVAAEGEGPGPPAPAGPATESTATYGWGGEGPGVQHHEGMGTMISRTLYKGVDVTPLGERPQNGHHQRASMPTPSDVTPLGERAQHGHHQRASMPPPSADTCARAPHSTNRGTRVWHTQCMEIDRAPPPLSNDTCTSVTPHSPSLPDVAPPSDVSPPALSLLRPRDPLRRPFPRRRRAARFASRAAVFFAALAS
jgi:hypothetical protein